MYIQEYVTLLQHNSNVVPEVSLLLSYVNEKVYYRSLRSTLARVSFARGVLVEEL